MNVLETIEQIAIKDPERIAVRTGEECLSYGRLWKLSGQAASWIHAHEGKEGKIPLAVYGHKSPWMLVAFLGCVRAGHGYCPLDVSLPVSRIHDILAHLPESVILAAEPCPGDESLKEAAGRVMQVRELCGAETLQREVLDKEHSCGSGLFEKADPSWQVKGEDLFYMIFTSGSTGKPKGVQITADCLSYFLDWSVTLGGDGCIREGMVF